MKLTPTLLIIVVAITSFCGCNSGLKQKTEQTNSTQSFRTLDTVLPFAGFWLSERYFNDIQKTKSPRQSQRSDESCITIPERTLLVTRMISGFHEGAADIIVVKNGDQYQFWDPFLNEKHADIVIISKDKIKIGNKYFLKLSSEYIGAGNNLHVLEEILFKGIYRLENGKTVEFKSNGFVTGLENFSQYEPVIDYMGPAMDVDQIAFVQPTDKVDVFGFKFEQDNLFLHELEYSEYDSLNKMWGKADYGKLVYKLKKVR